MSILQNLFGRDNRRPTRKPAPRRLGLEMLESRRVLATLTVDDNLVQCPSAGFTTIQAAINAANANDKIVVCDGTYTEQLLINSTKDGLQLEAKKKLKAIIKAPAGNVTPAIVQVDGAQGVGINGFTITGPIDLSQPGLHTGILVGGVGGSAKIENNRITKIRDEPLTGTQNGIAVLIGRFSTGETGYAEIKNNVIDDYQKGGIIVDNAGSDANIEKNKITGVGSTGLVAQIGIQISRGAIAEIESNEISKNQYTGAPPVSAGILLYQAGGETEVEKNKLDKNDIGIDIQFVTAANTEIESNTITNSTYFGILLIGSINCDISKNKISNSVQEGLYLTAGSTNNKVHNNEITRSGLDGIHVEDSHNNLIKENKVEKNSRDGIRVTTGSSNNTFQSNTAKNNTEHDLHDDTLGGGTAGTANLWKDNKASSEFPLGIKK